MTLFPIYQTKLFYFNGFCDIILGMKTNIFIFSSLLCLCSVGVQASNCTGAGCVARVSTATKNPYNAFPSVQASALPLISAENLYGTDGGYYYYANEPQTKQMKVFSVKPVPADYRKPVWDGTNGKFPQRPYDKTVDWQDGVPVWDDSIVSYKYKNFDDWFLQPLDEIHIGKPVQPVVINVSKPEPAPVPVMVNTVPVMNGQMEDCAPSPVLQEVPADTSVELENKDIVELYKESMAEVKATRDRVEELLAPRKPSDNLWATSSESENQTQDSEVKITTLEDSQILKANTGDKTNITVLMTETSDEELNVAPKETYVAQDLTEVVEKTFGTDDGCPFETEAECEIWRKKPVVKESVSPRSPKIRDEKIQEFIAVAKQDKDITANVPEAQPLLARYKMLMKSAQACCTEGMTYSLKKAGASDGLIYKFLVDDANFYGFGARCLMTTDKELDTKYPNTATASVVADVRNGCLCRGRQWFDAMLAPFADLYEKMPEFKDYKFNYTYTDGLGREITVSVNNDVKNVLNQLKQCP